MPTREQMEHNRFIPKSVLRSELWRFTRRSVPRGIALGIIVGVLLPFAQIIFAAMLSLPVRANVPLAALTTFITNPFTTPLIWAFSYQVGRWMLQVDAYMPEGPIEAFRHVTRYLVAAALDFGRGPDPGIRSGRCLGDCGGGRLSAGQLCLDSPDHAQAPAQDGAVIRALARG